MPDKGGYPTDKELKRVEEWDFEKEGVNAFLDFLESVWWMADRGFIRKWGLTSLRRKCLKVQMHTAGWSGNEDVIREVLKTNFWRLYWVRSDRGGHYYFEIPKGALEI